MNGHMNGNAGGHGDAAAARGADHQLGRPGLVTLPREAEHPMFVCAKCGTHLALQVSANPEREKEHSSRLTSTTCLLRPLG